MEKLIIDSITRENNQLEFKKAKGGLPNSFFETYSSFSNTKGGLIYLGLDELKNGVIITSMLTNDEIEKIKIDLFSLLNDPKKVSINLIIEDEVKTLEYDGYPVLEIKVNPAPKEYKPVYINNNIMTGSYRRNNEGDYHCTPNEIKAMLRDAEEKSIDLKIVESLSFEDLSVDTINSYKNRFRALHPEHVFLKNSDMNFLEYIGAIRVGEDKKYHPTIAGLLMFGYSYKIVYEFPEYFLDYQEHYSEDENIRWTDRITSDSGEWSGNMYDFYNRVVNKLTSDLKIPFKLNGIERVDDTILHQALREALCNTISNSDFYQRKGLVIKKYFDRIEFNNPGCLRISKEKAFIGGESDARNKTILKMFNLVGVGERAGSGIPKILYACKEYGFEEPNLFDEYNPDRTHLIINFSVKTVTKNDTKNDTKITEKEKQILTFIINNGPSKVIEISNALGFSITTIKNILYKLVDDDLVSSSGTIKDKRYFAKNMDNVE